MKKIKESKIVFFAILCIIFLLMFLCNSLTHEIADDYNYHFNWATGERLTNVFEIFDSMKVHYSATNGRLVANSFVQLFEILPKVIFNIVNSGVFVSLILIIYCMVSGNQKNNYLLFSVFGAVWVFSPAFGQVYLWLDGACNYMWAAVFGLLYLMPFVRDLLYDKPITNPIMKVAMVIFAFFVGAFSENGSAAVILMSVLLQLAVKFLKKRKFTMWGILSVISAIPGFYFMVSAPGTVKNKSTDLNFELLRENFIDALRMLKKLEILLIAFCILLVICVITKIKSSHLMAAIIFFTGALSANFIMAVAAYYPSRSLVFTAIFLIVSLGILSAHVFENVQYKVVISCAAAVLTLYTAYFVCIGVNDIYESGSKLKYNEDYIEECKANGISEITLPMIPSYTKYSAVNGLMYLSVVDSSEWPNDIVAKYYGVDSVIGYWK